MSSQHTNKDSSLNNLSESGASDSVTSGITGGSSGASGSGKGKESSSPIGTYQSSSNSNTSGEKQVDSMTEPIPGTKTSQNKNKN